jgi:hypothetical protein
MATKVRELAASVPGVSAAVLALRAELIAGTMEPIAQCALVGREIVIQQGHDAIWVIIRRPKLGGLALRVAHTPGGCSKVTQRKTPTAETVHLEIDSAIGRQTVHISTHSPDLPALRITCDLTPVSDLLVPFLPRDLYPLGDHDDPLRASGKVEAAQRGLNSGLLYFHLDGPAFGSILYFQNLTAMNDYYIATKTTPDGALGGLWPELGYLPPTPPQSGRPPIDPLPAGKSVTISDAILVFHDETACDEQDSARRFLQMLGAAYRCLEFPATQYRDWVGRADRRLRDLERAPEATIRHYGHPYIHPYIGTEYPDVMVQMSIIASLRDFATWRGQSHPFPPSGCGADRLGGRSTVLGSGLMNFAGVLIGGIAVAYALVEILPPEVLTPPNGDPAVVCLARYSCRRSCGTSAPGCSVSPIPAATR